MILKNAFFNVLSSFYILIYHNKAEGRLIVECDNEEIVSNFRHEFFFKLKVCYRDKKFLQLSFTRHFSKQTGNSRQAVVLNGGFLRILPYQTAAEDDKLLKYMTAFLNLKALTLHY